MSEYLGYIDLQTGFVLLASPDALPEWAGVETILTAENIDQYTSSTPTFFNPSMLLGYVEDSGTCDIFRHGDAFVLFASWLPDNGDENMLEPLAVLPGSDARFCGELHIDTDHLVASWAVNSGVETLSFYDVVEEGVEVRAVYLGTECLPFKTAHKTYCVYIDDFENDKLLAKRLYLVPQETLKKGQAMVPPSDPILGLLKYMLIRGRAKDYLPQEIITKCVWAINEDGRRDLQQERGRDDAG